MAATLHDVEFGEVTIKRIHTARSIRLRVSPGGILVATMPKRAPLLFLRRLIDDSREALRKAMADASAQTTPVYRDQQPIGASHRLVFHYADVIRPTASLRGQLISVGLPPELSPEDTRVQTEARTVIAKALRVEAKAYLPRRLRYLAETYGFQYETERFTHAKGRWGSCSTRGTISLNIALMMLPMELIDYVLIHELAHTRQMNHSSEFWAIVSEIIPDYKARRTQLKSFSPYI